MTRAARTSTSAGYPELMRQVAPLLGYDPRAADRNGVARYRSRGSLKIDFAHGTFSDFEAGIAGGVLDFIRHATGEDARNWFERQGLASRTKRYSPPRMMAAREIPRADLGAEPRELTDEQRASADFARAIFERAQPIDGVLEVAGYLAVRGGLDVTGCKSELRYSPATLWENERRKCLLVAYRSLKPTRSPASAASWSMSRSDGPRRSGRCSASCASRPPSWRRSPRRLLSPRGSRRRSPRTCSATARPGRLAVLGQSPVFRLLLASSGSFSWPKTTKPRARHGPMQPAMAAGGTRRDHCRA